MEIPRYKLFIQHHFCHHPRAVQSKMIRLSLLLGLVGMVYGHARLVDPAGRSSMWRFGFNTPVNWNDNELNCGGFGTQWSINQGKCGVCGDAWNQREPRENENGGKYGTGQIAKTYKEGEVISVVVDVTMGHLGWFEYRICNLDGGQKEDEACFSRHLMQLADGTGTRYSPGRENGKHSVNVELPKGLTCKHCVLQWHWRGGNSWGRCDDGREGMGCGPQETFRACADIAIE